MQIWRKKNEEKKTRRIKEKIVIPNNYDKSGESDDSWVCLKQFLTKCMTCKYSIFQKQQLLNLLIFYRVTHKRYVKITTNNLSMSLFFTGVFQRTHACIHRKTFLYHATRTIRLCNMGAQYNMRSALCNIRIVRCDVEALW